MKIFLMAAVLCWGLAGCGKTPAGTQAEELNTDQLTLQEADAALTQSVTTPQAEAVGNEVATRMVENKDAGPLVEALTPAVPDEVAALDGTPEPDASDPDGMAIQKALKSAGYYDGAIDGKIGPKTKEAIRAFQRKNNLTVDGKVGPQTWAILQKS